MEVSLDSTKGKISFLYFFIASMMTLTLPTQLMNETKQNEWGKGDWFLSSHGMTSAQKEKENG